MADNFNMKQFLVENKLGAYSKLKEEVEEAKKEVSKEDKIAVIKEWIWYTCDEGTNTEDISKYNKMVDIYFADKDDVTYEDFKNIWNKVTEKYGVGDVSADWDAFPETWKDVQTGTLVNEGEAAYEYEKGKAAGEKLAKEDLGKDLEDTEAAKQMDFLAEEEPLNEDASVVMDVLGMLAGLAGMGLTAAQILRWQNKLEKENPELYKQLGQVNTAIGAADPSKNLEEKKEEIKEALSPEAFERMDALTSTRAQLAMIKAAEIMMNELTKEGFEVLDIREYFTQLIANDI